MMYDMIKWFRSRTAKAGTWVDPPRIQPPGEEVEALTGWLESFYKNAARSFELRQRVLNDINDTVTLTLGIGEDELRELVSDDGFLKKSFGGNTSIISHLSMKPAPKSSDLTVERADVDELFRDTIVLLDQVSKWGMKYESQRSK
jgi:hypothetical protein